MTSTIPPRSAQQDLEGRSVRDIVEYSPEQVNEAWCRKILRKILQSLELQYAMQMPHRVITPDTVVFHANGEPLLISDDIDAAPAPATRLADDLTALARVLHYAVTQELAPTGPLHGRAPGYSAALIATVDACMAADPAQRPQDVTTMRALLGIVAPEPVAGAVKLPGAPLPAATSENGAVPLAEQESTAQLRPSPRSQAPAAALDGGNAPVLSGIQAGGRPAVSATDPVATPSADSAAMDEPLTRPLHADVAAPAAPKPVKRATPIIAAAAAASAVSAAHILHKPSAPEHAPDVARAAGPIAGPNFGPIAGIGPAPSGAPHPAGMRRGQRWAIGAGAAAIVIAIALALFAQLRDSGSFDHIALTLPQTGDGAHPGLTAQDSGATTATLADKAGAGVPGMPADAAPGNAASHPADSTPDSTAAGAARGEVTRAAPGSTANTSGTLAGSPASGASSGGTTVGGGFEPADGMTPVPPKLANANDSVAGTTPDAGHTGAATRTTEEASAAAAGLALGNASYQLQIKPWGIVYVDGVDRGVSPPVKRLALTPGRHTIRITNPNYRDSILEFDSAPATSNGKIIVDFNHEAQ